MFVSRTHREILGTMRGQRAKAFTLAGGIFAVVLVAAGGFEFIPAWVLGDPREQVHLWHIAELTALAAILLGGTQLMLLRHPEKKSLLAQFLVLGIAILAVGIAFFEIKIAALFIVLGLFVALYPDTRALLSVSREGRISKLLLGLSILLAFFLLPNAWREVQWQIAGMRGGDPHALELHWIGSAMLQILLILAGILSATKRPGWKQLGIITGVTYCFLGVIAMILQADYAGSWGGAGGLFAIAAGLFYISFTLLERQWAKEKSQATAFEQPATQKASK